MINYKQLKENGIIPKTIKKINKSFFVDTGNSRYILKRRDSSVDKKFNYLLSRGFNYFPGHSAIKNYDIYEYIEESAVSEEEKLDEMVDLMALLHMKTTRYKTIDLDDYKIIYEDIAKKLEYLNNYYMSLNDLIDNEIYMSPSHYLLALNISKIYSALSFCRNELDNWYDMIKESKKQRVSLTHNNLDLSHIIVGKHPYLISWEKSKVDMPVNDLLTLYNKYVNETDFSILLNNYQKRYPLRQEELKLFFIKISIPEKLEFKDDELENTRLVNEVLRKLKEGDKIIRPYYEKGE